MKHHFSKFILFISGLCPSAFILSLLSRVYDYSNETISVLLTSIIASVVFLFLWLCIKRMYRVHFGDYMKNMLFGIYVGFMVAFVMLLFMEPLAADGGAEIIGPCYGISMIMTTLIVWILDGAPVMNLRKLKMTKRNIIVTALTGCLHSIFICGSFFWIGNSLSENGNENAFWWALIGALFISCILYILIWKMLKGVFDIEFSSFKWIHMISSFVGYIVLSSFAVIIWDGYLSDFMFMVILILLSYMPTFIVNTVVEYKESQRLANTMRE